MEQESRVNRTWLAMLEWGVPIILTEVAEFEGDGSGLCELDGEIHNAGPGHRGRHSGRDIAGSCDADGSGVEHAAVVG